jgi:hypothetical protein
MAQIPEGGLCTSIKGRFFIWHNFTFLVMHGWKNNLGSGGGGVYSLCVVKWKGINDWNTKSRAPSFTHGMEFHSINDQKTISTIVVCFDSFHFHPIQACHMHSGMWSS